MTELTCCEHFFFQHQPNNTRAFITSCLLLHFLLFTCMPKTVFWWSESMNNSLKATKIWAETSVLLKHAKCSSWIAAHLLIESCLLFVLCLKVCCLGALKICYMIAGCSFMHIGEMLCHCIVGLVFALHYHEISCSCCVFI